MAKALVIYDHMIHASEFRKYLDGFSVTEVDRRKYTPAMTHSIGGNELYDITASLYSIDTLSSKDEARDFVSYLARVTSDCIVICDGFRDSDDDLRASGLKTVHSNLRSTMISMNSSDICDSLKDSGFGYVKIFLSGRSIGSAAPWIISIHEKENFWPWKEESTHSKPETNAVFYKDIYYIAFRKPNAQWEMLIKSIGRGKKPYSSKFPYFGRTTALSDSFSLKSTEWKVFPDVEVQSGAISSNQDLGIAEGFSAKYRATGPSFEKVNNAFLLGDTAAVFVDQGWIRSTQYLNNTKLLSRKDYVDLERQKVLVSSDVWVTKPEGNERVILGFNRAYREYFHWMIDCIPGIVMAKKLFSEKCKILLPALPSFGRASLKMFGIEEHSTINIEDEAVFVEEMLIPSQISGKAANLHPFVRSIYLDILETEKPRMPGRKIYVSRSDASRRVLQNEYELESMLKNIGFEVIAPGRFSLHEQATIFSEASVVVGPHGAGLTNCLFMRGGLVIELLPSCYMNNCFLRICQISGLKYSAYIVPAKSFGEGAHDIQWSVDVEDFVAFLHKNIALSEKESGCGC